jgi:hypothetical protein
MAGSRLEPNAVIELARHLRPVVDEDELIGTLDRLSSNIVCRSAAIS